MSYSLRSSLSMGPTVSVAYLSSPIIKTKERKAPGAPKKTRPDANTVARRLLSGPQMAPHVASVALASFAPSHGPSLAAVTSASMTSASSTSYMSCEPPDALAPSAPTQYEFYACPLCRKDRDGGFDHRNCFFTGQAAGAWSTDTEWYQSCIKSSMLPPKASSMLCDWLDY